MLEGKVNLFYYFFNCNDGQTGVRIEIDFYIYD